MKTPRFLTLFAATLYCSQVFAQAPLPVASGKIAFTRTRDTNTDIWVMNAGGSNQTRLTDNPGYDGQPSFSADGTKIAFVSSRSGFLAIWVMNADGSAPRRLTEQGVSVSPPHLSPDGKKVVFSILGFGKENTYNYIRVMNTDGTSATNLPEVPDIRVHDIAPCFSPDGTKIAFLSTRDILQPLPNDIWIMNTDGSSRRRITQDPRWKETLAFSPDGTKLVFATNEVKGQRRVCELGAVNVDGTGLETLKDSGPYDRRVSFSPDGRRIVFNYYVFHEFGEILQQIYVSNADGTGRMALTSHEIDDYPSWAPGSVPPPQ